MPGEDKTTDDDGCCHRTRVRGAPCPAGRACPYDAALYRWFWRARLPERRGQTFRVLARGALNSCLIEFSADGARYITSRNALRRA